MSQLGTTTGLQDWSFQDNHVERLLDNAAYTSAHPDDTLVLAGPARYNAAGDNGKSFAESLLAIGMLQGFSASQQKPVQPVMSIGSGRQFYVSGKAQTSWSAQRLFVNGRNLLRVLNTQAKQAGVNVAAFDDSAAADGADEQFWVNLDSELFLIPFGLAVFFRDKVHQNIGAFYIELCMIQSWSLGFNAGGSMIAEQVSGVADRIVPILPTGFSGQTKVGYPQAATLDTKVLGLTSTLGEDLAK